MGYCVAAILFLQLVGRGLLNWFLCPRVGRSQAAPMLDFTGRPTDGTRAINRLRWWERTTDGVCVALALVGALAHFAPVRVPLPTQADQPTEIALGPLRQVPGDRGNYRGPQPTARELRAALESGKIKTVIRLNAEGEQEGYLSPGEEQAICNEAGVLFVLINIEGANGCSTRKLHRVHEMLADGNCFIHCLHGFDRTGAAVGYHLRQLCFTPEKIIAHNDWAGYPAKKGAAYQKYYAAGVGN